MCRLHFTVIFLLAKVFEASVLVLSVMDLCAGLCACAS